VGADGKRTAVEEIQYMLTGSFHKHDFLGFIKNCWTDEQIKRSIAAPLFPKFHRVLKKWPKPKTRRCKATTGNSVRCIAVK
jgi:hypothetical protein